MLRAITNFGRSGNATHAAAANSTKSFLRQHGKQQLTHTTQSYFSVSADNTTTESTASNRSFEEKQAFFERFSNAYFGGDQLKEQIELHAQYKANNYSRDVNVNQITKELTEIYGKHADSILNKRFEYEIQGHRDGVAKGEFELFPLNVTAHGKFNRINVNADLVNQLHASNYLNLNAKETQTSVVPVDSHFSLLLDEYIPDEYVQELDDNQACLFGFAKSLDQADIIALLKQNNVAYSNIAFGECVMSLPAYAVLTFNSTAEAKQFKKSFNDAQHVVDKKIIYATTFEDSRSEHGRNRQLLVSGIHEDESFNNLLNFLSTLGSVMHFEFVQEPIHEALPTTEQVIAYLKKTVKEGDDSIIYEITDVSSTVSKIVEYPPYTPSLDFMRDGSKVIDVEDELEVEKERGKELAKRELLPRLVLNTWDSEQNSPAEYKLSNKSAESKKIVDAVQNELRHDFQNKKYLFVTFASRQQSEIAYAMLNSTGVYHSVLRRSVEHYHCDTAHQTSVFKEIKDNKRELKGLTTDAALVSKEQDSILAQSHVEMRRNLVDAANSSEFSAELSALLENEVISSTKHGFEHQVHLKNDKAIGREFSTKITKDDLNQIATQLQERQRDSVRKIESLARGEDAMLDLYRAKILNADFNKATHPYLHTSLAERDTIMENVQEYELVEYKQRQKEYLMEEQIKQRWIDNTREILENKFSDLPRENKYQRSGEREEKPKEAKEPEEKDQYYSLSTRYSLDKKQITPLLIHEQIELFGRVRLQKYQRYVSEMQSLYDGDYTEAMKDRIFNQADSKCVDVDGNVFVSEEKGAIIADRFLTEKQKSDINYYMSIEDILPKKKITDLVNQLQEAPDETIYMLSKLNLPTKVFDRNALQNGSAETSQELVEQLNRYIAGLGEVYEVQKDARGEEKIVLYSNEPHAVPLNALNIDEISMLRDCLTTYGLDAQATEREIQYFLQHGDYSEAVQAMIGNTEVDAEAELEQLMDATGLSKAELESIISIDLEQKGAEIVESLARQKEAAAFAIRMGPTRPQDLIKTNSKLRNKDNTGKFKTSVFKTF